MARKPRIEFEGAIYHVFNRGAYRTGLFAPPGAAQVFVDCLFEGCERMHWRLHAYCLAQNEYHLALETPRGNLAAGIHWVQSAFGNRFNRFRGERGRAFRSRYRAILTEPGAPLRELVDRIHLIPVEEKIVAPGQLAQFRWSSCRWLARDEDERPFALRPNTTKVERVVPNALFGTQAELASIARAEWQTGLEAGARALGRALEGAAGEPKGAPWKIALAASLKRSTSVSNRWLSEQLRMGPPDAVSRYVSELWRGRRPAAARFLEDLADKK